MTLNQIMNVKVNLQINDARSTRCGERLKEKEEDS